MTGASITGRCWRSLVLAAVFGLAVAVPGNAQIDPYGVGRSDPKFKKGDFANGLDIIFQAAERGDAEAQYTLGSKFEVWNSVNAPVWYSISANTFAEKAQRAVAERPRNRLAAVENARNRLAAKMTPAQIAEAQRLAREWLRKHSK